MRYLKHTTTAAGMLLAVLVTACSSNIPQQIRQPVEGAPGIEQVKSRIDSYTGRRVRWGGTIVETENRPDESRMIIIAFPLHSDGEPRSSAMSTGRFIAEVNTFLEPEIYKAEREVTVTGTITGKETIRIGDYPYQYPVVEVEHYYLWPVRQTPDYSRYPPYMWHDPFYPWPYYPYYPYYPHRHIENVN